MSEEEIDCIIFHLYLDSVGLLDEWFEVLEGVK